MFYMLWFQEKYEEQKKEREEELRRNPPSEAMNRTAKSLKDEEEKLNCGLPCGLCSKKADDSEKEQYIQSLIKNKIEWEMQNKGITGGYGFIESPKHSDYSYEWEYLEYNDDPYADEFIKAEHIVQPEEIIPTKRIKAKVDKNGIIKVTAKTAPGVHFWSTETIEIGGYVLREPMLYTASDLNSIRNCSSSIPRKWLISKLLILSDIPDDLKSRPHDYKAMEESDFNGVQLIDFSVEQKAYYLNWLESFYGNWNYAVHCYSRYISILWFRAFIEKKNLKEITLRFFHLSYFESGDKTNIKEMRRALCAYFLAVKEGVTFNDDEKRILAENFEKNFMHYHYSYKPIWEFDPIGFLSSLGHQYLPKAIMLLEYYGQFYSLWEDPEGRRHFQYALAATAYIIENMNVSFKNADEPRTMWTRREGLQFTISYYGGLEFTGKNNISPLAFIKEIMKGSDSLNRITFYNGGLPDFSWEKEYDALFNNLPESIIKKTGYDFHPTIRKIHKLSVKEDLSLLDILLTFTEYADTKEHIKEYEAKRFTLESERNVARIKVSAGGEDSDKASLFLWKISLKTGALKRRVKNINEVFLKPYHYEVIVDDFDEEVPLSKVPATIIYVP